MSSLVEQPRLTKAEQDIYDLLSQHPGLPLSRDILYQAVFGVKAHSIQVLRTVDVHIGRIRQKLPNHGNIQTVYGRGYVFESSTTQTMPFKHAKPSTICSVCRLNYAKHESYPIAQTLTILCDGTLVKI